MRPTGAIFLSLTLLGGAATAGDPLRAELQLVTDGPDMEGRQAQSPVWAPGPVPRLAYQATDRDKQTLLRIVAIEDGEVHAYTVPGSRSSRLERLGSGAGRSDRAVSWWDATGFFFVRSAGEGADLHYFDGVPRAVSGAPERVTEVLADPSRGRLFLTAEGDGEVDLFRFDSTALSDGGSRISEGPGTVEHSLSVDGSGEVVYVVTTRDETRIASRPPTTATGARSLTIPGAEILAVTPIPKERSAIVVARTCANEACTESRHDLIEQPLDNGGARVVATAVQVPPGLAPKPAISPDGRYVFYVSAEPRAGNPVVRLDRTTGLKDVVETRTRGAQEVSVAQYEGVLWLAVVAIGDGTEADVQNHLYMGPLR